MKVIILAGGLGTRLSEETDSKPKPMVEIGGKPILWHIMKLYSAQGFNEFIVCLGYKGYIIKEYFANYYRHQSDITIDLKNNTTEIHNSNAEPWKISLIDTGTETMTGGRIRRVAEYIGNERFLLTYGDGVSDVDINEVIRQHRLQDNLLTVTAVQPSGRFGSLEIDENNKVDSFVEKPKGDGSWINGGFFVCEPEIIDFIKHDQVVFEKFPMEEIAKRGKMGTHKHCGFWRPMDTLRDKIELEGLWNSGNAPWKIWM
jgi:glucose-1-phosphate cytidylyltransferase